jgi:hypothetical protein
LVFTRAEAARYGNPNRVAARRVGTKKHSALSTQQSAKNRREKSHVSGHRFVKMSYFAVEV